MSDDLDRDLEAITQLMRTHIEIRNRSWMKRVHRDCFIGSDAVEFLVTQGFADTREQAVQVGRKMVARKLIRHVTDSQAFRDAYLYYRFAEDDAEGSSLSPKEAGNGAGIFLGQGGCRWSFCPHTAHNSYVLDIALAEEIERAVAGASIEARARAVGKLRARIREEAEPDAPDWSLLNTTEVNKVRVSVFQRKRPRGDFKNVKITGMVPESPKKFIGGIMGFDRRKQWESMFEDGVIVEAIDIGEPPSAILTPDVESTVPTSPTGTQGDATTDFPPAVPEKEVTEGGGECQSQRLPMTSSIFCRPLPLPEFLQVCPSHSSTIPRDNMPWLTCASK